MPDTSLTWVKKAAFSGKTFAPLMPNPPDARNRGQTCLEFLGATRLFGGLGMSDLRTIESCSEMRSIPKGGYLFREGDRTAGLFVVGKGEMNIHRIDPGGREMVIRMFRAGDSFGEAFLADQQACPVSARAESASMVVLVRRADLIQLTRVQPEIAMRLLASMSQHLRGLVDRLGSLQHSTVAERLRDWLLSRCVLGVDGGPVTIELSLRKHLLAAEIGTVPETLSRTLSRFRDRGWVHCEGSAVTIHDPASFATAGLDSVET